MPVHLFIGQVTMKSYLAGRTIFFCLRLIRVIFLSLSIANLSNLGATVGRWSHITFVVLNSNTIHVRVYPYCTTSPYRIKIIMIGIDILDEILQLTKVFLL